jgi:hypothetical protein
MTYEKLIEKLMDFFSDTSRTPGQTKSGLLGLIDQAKSLIETIPEDPEDE